MKKKLLIALAVGSLLLSSPRGFAAEEGNAAAELKDLITQVQTKYNGGKKTEPEFADDLKAFDRLLAKHQGEKTDDVAQILYMKAMLYLQIFDNTKQGVELMEQLKRDFPATKQGQGADKLIASLRQQEEGKKIQRSLAVGSKFPDFNEKDVAGKPLSVANYKGKVVLIDFWATWCGPCVHELPNVLKAYEKHHKSGFEIIGISLDRDKAKLTNFTKEKNMPWQQYFDGQFWSTKLAVRYGVNSIPATYLLDREGKIIGKDLRGDSLDQAVATALAKK